VISDHRQIIVALEQHDAEGSAILAAAHAAKAKQEMVRRFLANSNGGPAA